MLETEFDPHMPAAIFDACVPRELQERTLVNLRNSYLKAGEFVVSLAREEAHDVQAHVRRAYFEGDWRAIAQSFTGVQAVAEANGRRTSFHTVIMCDRVVWTASAVASPTDNIREAEHRKTLVRTNQLLLFEEEPPPEGTLWAVLLHGADRTDPTQIAFAHIVFPLQADEVGYHEQRIDLLARFSLPSETGTVQEEIIIDDLNPEFREDIQQNGTA